MFELVPPESLLDEDQQQSLLYSSDLELGETTQQIFERVERSSAEPGRARQPVRDPPAGAELAALPAPDPGAQALLRPARRHRPAARRPDRRRARTRRCTASPTASSGWRSWRPTTAPSAGGCGSSKYRGRPFRGGYHDFTIETGGRARSSRGWSRPSTGPASRATSLTSGIAGARRPAGRRPGARLERPHPRPGGHRQVAAGAAVRGGGRRRAASRRRCSSSTRSSACCSTGRQGMGIDLEALRDGGHAARRADRRRRAVAGRVRAPGPRAASSRAASATVVIDSLNGYQAAMPRGAVR